MRRGSASGRAQILTVLSFLVILLLFTGCSWKEFEQDVGKIISSAASFGERFTNASEEKSPSSLLAAVKECGTDATCLFDAVTNCVPAQGILTQGGQDVDLTVNSSKNACTLDVKVIKGINAGAKAWCAYPKDAQVTFEVLGDPDGGYCDQSWSTEMKPYVTLQGPLSIPAMRIDRSQISFNATPTMIVYLQSIVISGPRIANCSLLYKNPVKLARGETQPFQLDCKVAGIGAHATGSLLITYFEKPDFKNSSTVQGSFLA